ncbi:RNA polymerase sigma factor [Thermodesulfobacteriota bacterium]
MTDFESFTDDDLIHAFKEGDEGAFEAIMDRYEGRLFGFLKRMCGHMEDAEESLQDTLLSAFKSLEGFRGEGSLKSWLYKIASSACLKKRRKGKFDPDEEFSIETFYSSAGDARSLEIPDLTDHPGLSFEKAELMNRIRDAVVALPVKYRSVLALRDFEGLSTDEAAGILGISASSVKTRLHRARMQMRESLDSIYAEHKAEGA